MGLDQQNINYTLNQFFLDNSGAEIQNVKAAVKQIYNRTMFPKKLMKIEEVNEILSDYFSEWEPNPLLKASLPSIQKEWEQERKPILFNQYIEKKNFDQILLLVKKEGLQGITITSEALNALINEKQLEILDAIKTNLIEFRNDKDGKTLLDLYIEKNNTDNLELLISVVPEQYMRLLLLNLDNSMQFTFEKIAKNPSIKDLFEKQKIAIEKLQKELNSFKALPQKRPLLSRCFMVAIGLATVQDMTDDLYNNDEAKMTAYRYLTNLVKAWEKESLDNPQLQGKIDELKKGLKPENFGQFYTNVFLTKIPFMVTKLSKQEYRGLFDHILSKNQDLQQGIAKHQSRLMILSGASGVAAIGAVVPFIVPVLGILALLALTPGGLNNKAANNLLKFIIKSAKYASITAAVLGTIAAGLFVMSNIYGAHQEKKVHKLIINEAKKALTSESKEK